MKHFNDGWYVIYTRPRHEKKICDQLRDKEIEFFFPLTRKLKTWSDRKKYIDVPLFPSYIFIYLNDINTFLKVLEIDGVVSYIRMGKEIVRVSDKVIDDLKLVLNNDEDILVSERQFQPGQKMIIQHGPLIGLNCEIVKYLGEYRALVRVSILERSIILSLLPDYLICENMTTGSASLVYN